MKIFLKFCEDFSRGFENLCGSRSGMAYMTLQAFFYSIQNVFFKLTNLSPFQICFARGIGMFLMNMGVIQVYELQSYPKDSNTSLILILRGVFGFLQIATFVCALKLISLIEVVSIFNLCPIFVAVTGAIFLK